MYKLPPQYLHTGQRQSPQPQAGHQIQDVLAARQRDNHLAKVAEADSSVRARPNEARLSSCLLVLTSPGAKNPQEGYQESCSLFVSSASKTFLPTAFKRHLSAAGNEIKQQ